MRDDDDRAGILRDQPLQARLALEVEVVIRLVEEQEVRSLHEQPRDAHELLFAAAHWSDRAMQVRRSEAQLEQCGLAPALVGRSAEALMRVNGVGVALHHPRQPLVVFVDLGRAHLRLEVAQLALDGVQSIVRSEHGRQGRDRGVEVGFLRQ